MSSRRDDNRLLNGSRVASDEVAASLLNFRAIARKLVSFATKIALKIAESPAPKGFLHSVEQYAKNLESVAWAGVNSAIFECGFLFFNTFFIYFYLGAKRPPRI